MSSQAPEAASAGPVVIALLNKCPDVPAAALDHIAEACTKTLAEVAAQWGWSEVWEMHAFHDASKAPAAGPRVVRMWVLPNPTVANALGFHDVDQYGHAYARVFWDPIRDNGGTLTSGPNSLSVTIDHESKETRGDRFCQEWDERPDGTETALELCDACEDVSYDVPTNGGPVAMSDHLLPAWFVADAPKPYTRCGSVDKPYSRTSGGYTIDKGAAQETQHFGRETTTKAPTAAQTFGDAVPEWKAALKMGYSLRHAKRGVVLDTTAWDDLQPEPATDPPPPAA